MVGVNLNIAPARRFLHDSLFNHFSWKNHSSSSQYVNVHEPYFFHANPYTWTMSVAIMWLCKLSSSTTSFFVPATWRLKPEKAKDLLLEIFHEPWTTPRQLQSSWTETLMMLSYNNLRFFRFFLIFSDFWKETHLSKLCFRCCAYVLGGHLRLYARLVQHSPASWI